MISNSLNNEKNRVYDFKTLEIWSKNSFLKLLNCNCTNARPYIFKLTTDTKHICLKLKAESFDHLLLKITFSHVMVRLLTQTNFAQGNKMKTKSMSLANNRMLHIKICIKFINKQLDQTQTPISMSGYILKPLQ